VCLLQGDVKTRRGKCALRPTNSWAIKDTPAVKNQSTSATPGIATAPRSVVQVPMTDTEPTGSGEVSVSVSILTAGFFHSKTSYTSNRTCRSSGSDCTSGLEWGSSSGPKYDLMTDTARGHVQRCSRTCYGVSLQIQQVKSAKFGYLSMMVVTTLGALNAETVCERVLSCVKLVWMSFNIHSKNLVWSTRIGRIMPIWILCLIPGEEKKFDFQRATQCMRGAQIPQLYFLVFHHTDTHI
jgi:hypothetical protein